MFLLAPNIYIFAFLLVFVAALGGLSVPRTNAIALLLCLELLLLVSGLIFTFSSMLFDDVFGQVFTLFILTVAAAEASVGLALLVLFVNQQPGAEVETLGI
jgi:NADH-quinone oxidoreductase subunit K